MLIRLVGVFEVRDGDGRDCTPRGAKARALLAMLCQTPGHRRPRRWIESRLWSDRAPEQASGSLRQALTELRKALGPMAGQLAADRDSVVLEGISTDVERYPEETLEALRNGREFLEGIDILDGAFLDWLSEERERVAVQLGLSMPSAHSIPTSQRRPPYVLRMGTLPDGPGAFIARDLAQAIARLTAEFLHIDVFDASVGEVPEGLSAVGLELRVEGAWIQDRAHLMVSLIERANQKTLWSQRLSASRVEEVAEGLGEVPSVVFEATEAAIMQMPRLAETEPGVPVQVNSCIARAIVAMFTYDTARLREADQLLAEAEALMPSDRICAWRSLVRQIMFVEMTEPNFEELKAESDVFARRALEMSDGTPLVLALVSYTRVMVDENPEAGTVLARDAVRRSPFNPFGYWAMTGASIRLGQNDEALALARRGAEIASRTPIVHSWEGLAGLAALRGGHFTRAIAHYEAAHFRAPGYRAAMRHLLFLYLWSGEREKAARVYRGLLRVEPGFTLERILHEPGYPAVTLRKSGLLEKFGPELATLL